jgi:hypothetical protein
VSDPGPRAGFRRRTPLAPGRHALKRSGPPARRSPLKAKAAAAGSRSTLAYPRKPPATAAERRAADLWQQQVKAAGVCVASGVIGVPLDAHHVIPKRLLRALERRLGLTAGTLVWDCDNGIALCAGAAGGRCHMRHESAFARIPRQCLPPQALVFAARHCLTWFIERHYPADEDRGSGGGIARCAAAGAGRSRAAGNSQECALVIDHAEEDAERT